MCDQTVKVAVRIRPLIDSEKHRGCQNIIQKTPSQPQIAVHSGNKNYLFTFNFVFAPEDTQQMVYENAVKSMVLNLFQGYNVTVLAYGQTGSGKTHTMGASYDSDDIGVIPLTVADIFDHMQDMTEFDFTVSCSFMELYQEKLYDLLSTQPRDQSIVDIREVKDNKIAIPNLTEIPVKDAKETTECLRKGSAKRAVGSTAMNATSSRSHAIFTITLQKVSKINPRDATSAKFHLVDLAGSERSKKTLTIGEQFKEGVKINQGLLALGKVISALGSANNSNQHIGYRESKLTRLLQDSLGGNSMTLMIACISPADYNMEETLGTLRYADRAKKIKNKPVINLDPKTVEINNLKAEVQKLLSKNGIGETVIEKCQKCKDAPKCQELQSQLGEMAAALQAVTYEFNAAEKRLQMLEQDSQAMRSIVQKDKHFEREMREMRKQTRTSEERSKRLESELKKIRKNDKQLARETDQRLNQIKKDHEQSTAALYKALHRVEYTQKAENNKGIESICKPANARKRNRRSAQQKKKKKSTNRDGCGCKKSNCKASTNCKCHKMQNGCNSNCLCTPNCQNAFNEPFGGVERTSSQDSVYSSGDDKENRARGIAFKKIRLNDDVLSQFDFMQDGIPEKTFNLLNCTSFRNDSIFNRSL